MFKPLVTRFLQHITDQNSWSRKHLAPFASSVLLFDIALIKTNLLILEDGSLSVAGETVESDATIRIPPSLALRLLAKDTELATEVSKVMQLMRWDIEEDLSKVIGDIPAHQLTKTSKKVIGELKKQSVNIAEMLTEYWQEEKNILSKTRHITQFNQDVDHLRNDTDRLEKRIKKLSKQIEESHIH